MTTSAPINGAAQRNKRNISILPLTEDDLYRCAEIALAAFESDTAINPLVRPARLRNPNLSHEERVSNSARGMKAQMFGKPGKVLLKAVDDDTGKIVGVAVWNDPSVPIKPKEGDEDKSKEFEDPEEDSEFMGKMIEAMTSVREKHLSGKPHWCVVPHVHSDL